MRCGSSSLVAQSMTAIMFRVFQNLQPSEFHEGAWEVKIIFFLFFFFRGGCFESILFLK